MSGETEEAVSGWTVDTLRQEIHGLLRESDRRYEQRFEAQEQANEKFESENRAWREQANEWRGAMTDRERDFLSRREAEQQFYALNEKVDAQGSRLDRTEGRGIGLNAGWVYLLGAASFVAAIVAIALALTR